jgi:hypothetical protein
MLAHLLHLLQPLEVGCFGPLKRAYRGFIEARSQLGFCYIEKLDFLFFLLKAYPSAHSSAFTS